MKVINNDDENFPPRNIELTNIFRTLKWSRGRSSLWMSCIASDKR